MRRKEDERGYSKRSLPSLDWAEMPSGHLWNSTCASKRPLASQIRYVLMNSFVRLFVPVSVLVVPHSIKAMDKFNS